MKIRVQEIYSIVDLSKNRFHRIRFIQPICVGWVIQIFGWYVDNKIFATRNRSVEM